MKSLKSALLIFILNFNAYLSSADEELVVTGSYLNDQTIEASPIEIMSAEKISDLSLSSISEISKFIHTSSGSHFQSDSLEGTDQGMANINLRGLNLSATLVMVNSIRNTVAGVPAESGDSYVDINLIPQIAIQQLEIFKEYNPVNDKDSDKKIKYLEEVPEIVRNANLGLTELGVASSSVTCERQISIPNDNQVGEDFFSYVSLPLLPVVGRIDFDFGNPNEFGANPTEHFSTPFVGSAFPHKIIELKTKYSRLGKVKKDGSRSFLVSSVPATASFNHCVQVATYAAHFQFKVPAYLLYATKDGYVIFDSTNCPHLTVDGMKKNLQIMFNTFRRREQILTLYQDFTREEIIEGAASLMDMNLDHPFAWNGMPPELLKEAKLLWKLS